MEYGVLHLFCGIGGGAIGFQQATEDYRGIKGTFKTLAGIDVDPEACEDFANLTGAPAVQMDLFNREDYAAFHGHEPPKGWREATPEDIRAATGGIAPDVVFTSPPCKGFSGLLPKNRAESAKYQALNNLTVRGIWLTLEAWKNDLPGIILLENVPRITTRGTKLLNTIKGMLQSYGYAVHDGYHDCGEIGGLGQHRRRYLLIARHPGKVKPFVYKPPVQRVKSIGEIIGPLPLPDDPAGGKMHRLPRLQWKTWVRLALISAGGDWRDLEKIAPEQYRLKHTPRDGVYRIIRWEEPATTIIGSAAVGKSNGAACVADPRLGCRCRNGSYGVHAWDKPAYTVTSADIHAGCAAVADPRIPEDHERPDPPPVIIAPDGTWHRPMTTLELATLQGFPLTMSDGRPLELAGNSDARWRERIGNAVPPPAARAIGETMLRAMLPNALGEEFVLGATGIWVKRHSDWMKATVEALLN
ncbi:MAG: DNA cytosine methyltransferase [Thermosipho sp. (in: Bacteria)]|nr:DNA cytosine methyltransferase [Thermosipho sp. (in: thermotogales)]